MFNEGLASNFFMVETIILALFAIGFAIFSVPNSVPIVIGMISIAFGLLSIANVIKEYSKGTK